MRKKTRRILAFRKGATDEEMIRWTRTRDVFDRLEAGVSEIMRLAEGYRAMAAEDRETAERRLLAFREIFKLGDLRWAARSHLLHVLERQPGALSQAEADRIATGAKHRARRRRRK